MKKKSVKKSSPTMTATTQQPKVLRTSKITSKTIKKTVQLVKKPNKETKAALEDAQKGKDITTFHSFEDFLKSME